MNRLEGKLGQRIAGILTLGAACLFTGCGGEDAAPSAGSVAPTALAGRSYNLNESAGTSILSFASPTDYTMQMPDVPVEDGTWVGALDGNTWNLGLTTDAGGTKTIRMTFTSASNGSYVLSRSGQPDRSGTFSQRSSGIPNSPETTGGGDSTASGGGTGDGSTDGTSDGSSNGGSVGDTDGSTVGDSDGGTTSSGGNGGNTTGFTDGSSSDSTDGTTGSTDGSTTGSGPSTQYTGNAPVSLHARTLYGTRTFTSTGPTGQTHTYTFNGNAFHDSDPPEESDGTFSYNATNSRATLILDYTSPAEFVGDHHQMDMDFSSRDRGTFTSTYVRGDGTTITINGTFELDPLP